MNSKFKLVLGAAALVLVILFASMLYKSLSQQYLPNTAPKSTSQSEEKVKAPDFTVFDANGDEVKLSDFIGSPVVVNFWASWCPPCKSELPDFDKLAAEFDGEVVFMMVNATDGSRETVETATDFLSQQTYTFPVYFDTEFEASYAYGIRSLPTTLFIDKDGYLIDGIVSMLDEKTLRKGIELINK